MIPKLPTGIFERPSLYNMTGQISTPTPTPPHTDPKKIDFPSNQDPASKS